MEKKNRCPWAGDSAIYIDYHDKEWGRPERDDRKLFEMLILEGMQAGLSWITVLKKRDSYRAAFDNFDPEKIARYDEAKVEELMANPGIIRNRLKIQATITNAQAFLKFTREQGSFSAMLWRYVDNTPIVNHLASLDEAVASTPLSDRISKDLKKMGFKFVGSTIIYAFMQAVGMVNDHLTDCIVYRELVKQGKPPQGQ
ncbi:MAG: DNA-3-methyladenine glycosylase I [Victivallaceae bacterium]